MKAGGGGNGQIYVHKEREFGTVVIVLLVCGLKIGN